MSPKCQLLLAADRQVHKNWHGRGTIISGLPFLTEETGDRDRARRQADVIRQVGFCEATRERFAEVHYGHRDLVVILCDGTPVLTIHKTWQSSCQNAETMRPRRHHDGEV